MAALNISCEVWVFLSFFFSVLYWTLSQGYFFVPFILFFLIHFPRVISNIDLSVNIFLLPFFSSLLHLIAYFFELRDYSIIKINQSQHNDIFSWFYYYYYYYSMSLTHTHIPDTLWRSHEIFIKSYCFFHHCIWSLGIRYRLFALFFQVTCTLPFEPGLQGLYFKICCELNIY